MGEAKNGRELIKLTQELKPDVIIIEAEKTVYNNNPYYCKTTSSKVAQMIVASRFNPYKKIPKVVFTKREIEIIKMINQEVTNKEIGDKLFLSVRTIDGNRLDILEKIQAKNTAGLIIYAIKNGI